MSGNSFKKVVAALKDEGVEVSGTMAMWLETVC